MLYQKWYRGFESLSLRQNNKGVTVKEKITTNDAPKADHILSQAVVSNNMIYVSGQIHTLPDNSLVEGSTEDKMNQIVKNISAILEAANAKLDNIVKVVIYVTDMTLMPEINEVYPGYFAKPYPVREAVCVKALPLNASIEISVVASR